MCYLILLSLKYIGIRFESWFITKTLRMIHKKISYLLKITYIQIQIYFRLNLITIFIIDNIYLVTLVISNHFNQRNILNLAIFRKLVVLREHFCNIYCFVYLSQMDNQDCKMQEIRGDKGLLIVRLKCCCILIK